MDKSTIAILPTCAWLHTTDIGRIASNDANEPGSLISEPLTLVSRARAELLLLQEQVDAANRLMPLLLEAQQVVLHYVSGDTNWSHKEFLHEVLAVLWKDVTPKTSWHVDPDNGDISTVVTLNTQLGSEENFLREKWFFQLLSDHDCTDAMDDVVLSTIEGAE